MLRRDLDPHLVFVQDAHAAAIRMQAVGHAAHGGRQNTIEIERRACGGGHGIDEFELFLTALEILRVALELRLRGRQRFEPRARGRELARIRKRDRALVRERSEYAPVARGERVAPFALHVEHAQDLTAVLERIGQLRLDLGGAADVARVFGNVGQIEHLSARGDRADDALVRWDRRADELRRVAELRLERQRGWFAFERQQGEMRVTELLVQQLQDPLIVDVQTRDERAPDAREQVVIFDALGERVRRLRAQHRRRRLVGEQLREPRLARREAHDALAAAEREAADEPPMLRQRHEEPVGDAFRLDEIRLAHGVELVWPDEALGGRRTVQRAQRAARDHAVVLIVG